MTQYEVEEQKIIEGFHEMAKLKVNNLEKDLLDGEFSKKTMKKLDFLFTNTLEDVEIKIKKIREKRFEEEKNSALNYILETSEKTYSQIKALFSIFNYKELNLERYKKEIIKINEKSIKEITKYNPKIYVED